MGDAHDIHHRMRRREGHHAWSNLILLCRVCHHQQVHANPSTAQSTGFIVPTWADAEEVPVRTWRGWMLLKNDGTILLLKENRPTDAIDWFHANRDVLD